MAYQWWKGMETEDVVSQFRTITCNISKGPDSLFSHIGLWTGEEFDEDGDGISVDDGLGLT